MEKAGIAILMNKSFSFALHFVFHVLTRQSHNAAAIRNGNCFSVVLPSAAAKKGDVSPSDVGKDYLLFLSSGDTWVKQLFQLELHKWSKLKLFPMIPRCMRRHGLRPGRHSSVDYHRDPRTQPRWTEAFQTRIELSQSPQHSTRQGLRLHC
ncbi:hypothetical protein SKAU_G00188290 [Synaphobranchus kaupii]|uniref:Uncharacterized protein n=1 Tax=Synaphobranchus kaupii TaxID=118154 RepID=A0A9Q1IX60_SYNKA|nr:hypothetical protein SKAU_G00188290 [Synaphobranchus kaupii]